MIDLQITNTRKIEILTWCVRLGIAPNNIILNYDNSIEYHGNIHFNLEFNKWMITLNGVEQPKITIPHELGHVYFRRKLGLKWNNHVKRTIPEISKMFNSIEDFFVDFYLCRSFPLYYEYWLEMILDQLKTYPSRKFTLNETLIIFFLFQFNLLITLKNEDRIKCQKQIQMYFHNIKNDPDSSFPIDIKEFNSNIKYWYDWFNQIKDLNNTNEFMKFYYDIINVLGFYDPEDIKNALNEKYGYF